jgi:site-specific recombinase XerD
MATSFTPSHPDIQLETLQEQFFRDLKLKGRSINTLKNYRTDLECFNGFLRNQEHTTPLAKFNLAEVQSYGEYLDHRYSSDNSRRRRVQALRLFFDFLVQEKIFSSNPVRKLPTSPKFLDRPRPTPFIDVKTFWHSLLEESRVKDSLPKLTAMRHQVIFLLIYEGGLKVSDLAGLKQSQLFLNDEPRVLIDHPRRDPYTIALPQYFKNICEEYLTLLKHQQKKDKQSFDQVLFNANPHRILSGGLSSRGLEMIFEDYRKRLLITLTPKSLRQACIFRWLAEGHSDSLIKEWLGLAPSYSLKPYHDHRPEIAYTSEALEDIYWEFKNRRRQ